MSKPLGAEQELIEAALQRLGAQPGGAVVAAAGHDCAILDFSALMPGGGAPGGAQAGGGKAPGGRRLNQSLWAITTDVYVEGVHFSLRYGTLSDAGYRALMANLSDLAACGAAPRWGLAQCGVPPGQTALASELLNGVEAANAAALADCGGGIALIGGDTYSAPQWSLGFTLLGELSGQPILRSGAQPGDLIWASGSLGLAQAGLHALYGGLPGFDEAKAAHLRPRARLKLGQWLRQRGLASAGLDLSDSLSQCLLLLAEASGVGLSLDLGKLKLHGEVSALLEAYKQQAGRVREAGGQGRPPHWETRAGGSRYGVSIPARLSPGGKALRYASAEAWLLDSAEDYELLFTAPPQSTPVLLREAPVPLSLLGTVVAGEEGCHWRGTDGQVHPLSAGGYQHFGR